MNDPYEFLTNNTTEPLDELLAAIGLPPQSIHEIVEPQEPHPSCPIRWLDSPD